MSKTIKLGIAGGVILFILALIGGSIWLGSKQGQQNQLFRRITEKQQVQKFKEFVNNSNQQINTSEEGVKNKDFKEGKSNYRVDEIFTTGYFSNKGNVYKNNDYGFIITFPSSWSNYKTKIEIYSDKENNHSSEDSNILNKVIKVNDVKNIENKNNRYAQISFALPVKQSLTPDNTQCGNLIEDEHNAIVDICGNDNYYYGPAICSNFNNTINTCDNSVEYLWSIIITPIADWARPSNIPMGHTAELGKNEKFVFTASGVAYGTKELCSPYNEETTNFMKRETEFCSVVDDTTFLVNIKEHFKFINKNK